MDLVSFAFDAQREFDEQKPLFISAEQPSLSLSASVTRKLVRALIAGLRSRGLREGDSVLLCIGNHYLYPTIFFAVVGSGGVVCPVNPAYHFTELDHICHLSTPRFMITNQDALPTVLKVCVKTSIPASNVFLLDDIHNVSDLHGIPDTTVLDGVRRPQRPAAIKTSLVSELLSYGQSDWMRLQDEMVARNTPAAYYVTSGTTGLPKLAQLSHFSLIFQHQSLYHKVPYSVIRLACLPLFHIFGAAWALISPLRYGQPVYIMSRFKLETYVQNIEAFAVTETFMAPPMVHALNNIQLPLEKLLSSLRYVGIGGAPIGVAAMDELGSRLSPQATLTQVWGMTEFGPATLFRWTDTDDKDSVGRLLPGYDIKLADGEGDEIVAWSGSGSIFIRTPAIMMGYRGVSMSDEEKCWFPTGDVGRLQDGMLYITGRSKEMIKVRGWQVAPAELEAVISRHSCVSDCAVVGVITADGLAETPRAFVVRRTGTRPDEYLLALEICKLIQQELASYKALGGGVVFVGEIPRNASGKTQRHKLLPERIYSAGGSSPPG